MPGRIGRMPELVTLPATLRDAARPWAARSVRQRLAVVRGFRRALAAEAGAVARTIRRRPPADTIAAEILPLLDAARFLEREAEALLAPRRLGRRGRPAWLVGHDAVAERVPLGAVLVIAPSNYPILLGGIQAMQGLIAGNGVALKPGRGGADSAAALAALLARAGLPDGLLAVTDADDDTGRTLARLDFDRIVLTGSGATGRAVLAAAAPNLVPCTMELSGADPVFVLPGADLDLVARCLAYGLRLNGGATCIAPRLVLAHAADAAALETRLLDRIATIGPVEISRPSAQALACLVSDALARGARLHGAAPDPDADPPAMRPLVLAGAPADPGLLCRDIFAPWLALVAVDDMEQALSLTARLPLALGASVFGPREAATSLARRLDCGAVTVNDLIAPTADPRLGFGGTRHSGFGATRGPEGLLEMTRLRTVSTRARLAPRPHLAPTAPGDLRRMTALVTLLHGGGAARGRAIAAMLGSGRAASHLSDTD